METILFVLGLSAVVLQAVLFLSFLIMVAQNRSVRVSLVPGFIGVGLILASFFVQTSSADAAEVPTYQAALLVVNPTARPVEDGYDCGQGWVMDEYEPTSNGGAHVTCVKMKKGETRQGFIARRNAGKQYRLVF